MRQDRSVRREEISIQGCSRLLNCDRGENSSFSTASVDSGRLLRVTEKLGGHPNGGNSLKSPQEIRTRSDAHGSISIQEGQPIV
jgi:hypothetical protein